MEIENFLNSQLFVYFLQFVYVSHISHLEASNTKVAQTKYVWDENLKFLRWSAVCILSADYLLFSMRADMDSLIVIRYEHSIHFDETSCMFTFSCFFTLIPNTALLLHRA